MLYLSRCSTILMRIWNCYRIMIVHVLLFQYLAWWQVFYILPLAVISHCILISCTSMRCLSVLQCVWNGVDEIYQNGLQLGNYYCVCKEGYVPTTGNNNVTLTYVDGRTAEETYYHNSQGSNPISGLVYNTTLMCVPCTVENCARQTGLCVNSSSPLCSMVPHSEVRLPLLALTALTMVAVLMLALLTFRYRNDKVSTCSVLPSNICWNKYVYASYRLFYTLRASLQNVPYLWNTYSYDK